LIFSTERFRASTQRKDEGFLKPNKFNMVFGIPRGLNGGQDYSFIRNAARYLQFKIDAVTWPNVALNAKPLRRFGYGPYELAPFQPLFNTMKITVLCGGMGEEWTFFRRWLNLIFNFHHGYDIASEVQDDPFPIGGVNPQDVYELAYRDDFQTEIQLRSYHESGEEIMRVILRNAFPLAIENMVYDWADNKKMQEFNVGFHFMDWYQEVMPAQLHLGATTTNREVLAENARLTGIGGGSGNENGRLQEAGSQPPIPSNLA